MAGIAGLNLTAVQLAVVNDAVNQAKREAVEEAKLEFRAGVAG